MSNDSATSDRVRQWARSWQLQLFVLACGVFGIILTGLPDIAPGSALISLPPTLGRLDAGYTELGQFDEVDANGTDIAVLRRGDIGYTETYDLLRVCDPSLPDLQTLLTEVTTLNVGAIFSFKEIAWHNPHGELVMFQPVLILLDVQKPKPVCDLRDLAFLIHDRKIRYWSCLGAGFALAALFAQVGLSMIQNNGAEATRSATTRGSTGTDRSDRVSRRKLKRPSAQRGSPTPRSSGQRLRR